VPAGKQAWLDLESDPELEFQFMLAAKLSRTRAELLAIDHDEYVLWTRYYARRAAERELEIAKLRT
jgi:hypothetical protein